MSGQTIDACVTLSNIFPSDTDGSGTSPNCVSATIGSERLVAATEWLRDNKKIGLLGEFAGGVNAQCQAAITDMLKYMNDNSGKPLDIHSKFNHANILQMSGKVLSGGLPDLGGETTCLISSPRQVLRTAPICPSWNLPSLLQTRPLPLQDPALRLPRSGLPRLPSLLPQLALRPRLRRLPPQHQLRLLTVLQGGDSVV